MAPKKSRYGWWWGFVIGGLLLAGRTPLLSAQEFRMATELPGVIAGSVEPGKLILSAGDKIYVGLDKEATIKIGDSVDIFQVALVPEKEGDPPLYRRVGQGILLEILRPNLLVCIIDKSLREISVGDRLFLGPSK